MIGYKTYIQSAISSQLTYQEERDIQDCHINYGCIRKLAAVLLTTVLVSATVAAVAEEKVEFESTSMPALNCSMALSQAHGIFNLMPNEIQSVCRNEFVKVSARCAQNSEFTYQGVRVKTRAHEGLVDLTFTYAGNTVKVKNASWESLGLFFSE